MEALFQSMGVVGLVIMLVLGMAVFFAVVFGLVFYMVSRTATQKQAAAQQDYPNARHIEPNVNFFGQESRGVMQARGNGTLILTDSELIFQQWVVNKEFRIPYRTIQSIDTPKSHLGKTQGVPLLKISYLNESGTPDSIAWRVRDLGGLMRLIEEARTG